MVHSPLQVKRTGFTILETLIALGMLMLALVLTAQLAAWSMLERAHTQMRLEGAEAAANVLEAAKSIDWQQLGPDWAHKQKLTDYASARLRDAQLNIHIDNETPRVKRVHVEIQWPQSGRAILTPVHLIAYFGNRDTSHAGARP